MNRIATSPDYLPLNLRAGSGAAARETASRSTTATANATEPASLVATAKLNGVGPWAWLTDVLGRLVSGWAKARELERLLPLAWKAEQLAAVVNA